MGPIDAFWHFANLIAPGLGLGLIAAALAKLLWRRELAAVPWRRLATWAASASIVALLAGLVISGRDGRMGTYGAMVMACAAALWWTGFRRRGG
jgi:vacuolar-type H+-ATPase subunit I/STV1